MTLTPSDTRIATVIGPLFGGCSFGTAPLDATFESLVLGGPSAPSTRAAPAKPTNAPVRTAVVVKKSRLFMFEK